MERSEQTFITPEQQDDIRIDKLLVESVFIKGVIENDDLNTLRRRFTLSPNEIKEAKSLGVDVELIETLKNELDTKAVLFTQDAVDYITKSVFESGLYSVFVISEGKSYLIEGVVAKGESVHPMVNGEPFSGPIGRVVFDS